jgi:hypothetical protein
VAYKRVLIIINKWWECDPIMNVLLHYNARPPELKWPESLNHPRPRPDNNALPAENYSAAPRAVYKLNNIVAEVWCISDLLEHYLDEPKYQSSSEVKMKHLPRVLEGEAVDLVVAVGTAGHPSSYSENGSVIAGSRVFMHNSHPNGENPDSNWSQGPFDQIFDSDLSQENFNEITLIETSPKPSVLDRFMIPPLNPASYPRLLARYDYVALANTNVTNNAEFPKTDEETLSAFCMRNNLSLARSLETTHGLIRKMSKAPFLFISGITNRVGHFGDEVKLRSYSQNTSVAHNIGIVLSWMLPRIDAIITGDH